MSGHLPPSEDPVETDGRKSPTGETTSPRRHPVLVWGERLLTAMVLVFVFVRLGPQLGAFLGVGPDLGRAPDYTFQTLDGDWIESDALRGQVVVLNFWATWCGPCKLEMPTLQALHEDRAADGVVVLGLATDAGSGDAIAPFLAERDITYPVGRATQAHRQAFGGIPAIPTTFLIDRAGTVRHRVVGYLTSPALRVAVNRLLDEELPPESGPSGSGHTAAGPAGRTTTDPAGDAGTSPAREALKKYGVPRDPRFARVPRSREGQGRNDDES